MELEAAQVQQIPPRRPRAHDAQRALLRVDHEAVARAIAEAVASFHLRAIFGRDRLVAHRQVGVAERLEIPDDRRRQRTSGLRVHHQGEAVRTADALPAGTRVGKNDWGNAEYGGPCPPIGRHRYFHKLYALDTVLADLNQPNKAALEKAMQGHIIGEATLMGTYQKAKGG